MLMAKQPDGAGPPEWQYGNLPDPEWKLPFALAVGLHVAVVVMTLLSPVLFSRPPLPEIQTVNLFSAVEPGPPLPAGKAGKAEVKKPEAPAPPKPEPREIKTVETTAIKKEVAPPAEPKVAPPKAEAISEKPIPAKTAKDLAKLKEIKKLLAEQQAKDAQKFADRQIKDALAQLKEAYKNQAAVAASTPAVPAPPAAQTGGGTGAGAGTSAAGTGTATGGGQGAMIEEALRRYLAAVHARIHEHWKLPDLQTWDDSLEAVYVVRVRKDGTLVANEFERTSKNPHFNQFVEKAIREASPLPPFPPELREEELEIGLRFRPGVIL